MLVFPNYTENYANTIDKGLQGRSLACTSAIEPAALLTTIDYVSYLQYTSILTYKHDLLTIHHLATRKFA